MESNPLEMDEKIIGLKNRVNTLENQLKLLRGYEIAVEPVIPEEPAKPKKALIIAVASISGIFLGVFLALFMEWMENARNRHQNVENYPKLKH